MYYICTVKYSVMYYHRKLEGEILKGLNNSPVTAIIGPRQCGKSTLARQIVKQLTTSVVYLDLGRPSDLDKLDNAEWFFSQQKGSLICLDEIQRKPDLFSLIRSLVDEWGGNGHFLVLGSASRDLIKQSSESLAGRITFKQLHPFIITEIKNKFSVEEYLVKGGFPRSILSDDNESFEWREDFVSTFLERDLLQWSGFSTNTMRKLWRMIAVLNGNVVNYNLIATSLGISPPTAKNYVELLSATFMVRLLPPYLANTGKRLIKSPKLYLTDSGISNNLLGIENFSELLGHPGIGAAWETLVLANLSAFFPKLDFYFYRTNHGSELDFIIERKGKIVAVECKVGAKPSLTRGSYAAIADLKPEITLIICPVKKGWSFNSGIEVTSLLEAFAKIQSVYY